VQRQRARPVDDARARRVLSEQRAHHRRWRAVLCRHVQWQHAVSARLASARRAAPEQQLDNNRARLGGGHGQVERQAAVMRPGGDAGWVSIEQRLERGEGNRVERGGKVHRKL